MSQITENIARLGELEAEVQGRSSEAASLRKELEDRMRKENQADSRMQQMKELHHEQCQELEAQIDKVSCSNYSMNSARSSKHRSIR